MVKQRDKKPTGKAKAEIRSDGAPAAIGPYSQGVSSSGFVFISGQIPLDPASGEVVSGSVGIQTRRVLENLKALLEEAALTMDSVVKTTVYMTDLAEFTAMNEVYAEYFTEPYPARATVEVKALPKGVAVEIDAVAVEEEK